VELGKDNRIVNGRVSEKDRGGREHDEEGDKNPRAMQQSNDLERQVDWVV
jgi:hypothetical protein